MQLPVFETHLVEADREVEHLDPPAAVMTKADVSLAAAAVRAAAHLAQRRRSHLRLAVRMGGITNIVSSFGSRI